MYRCSASNPLALVKKPLKVLHFTSMVTTLFDSAKSEVWLQSALDAGQAIMGYYGSTFDVQQKEDHSPVTEADYAAHRIIVEALTQHGGDRQIVSEEDVPKPVPRCLEYWLVDPLDGTKSFIAQQDEFTVNIALVRDGKPVWGVVYAPAKQALYYTEAGKAWRVLTQGHSLSVAALLPLREAIHVRPTPPEGLTVLASKSHRTVQTDAYVVSLEQPVAHYMAASSSYKFCLLAEGAADLYPRFGPTMQWDTAAGQAVLEAAGGNVHTPEGALFTYHQKAEVEKPFLNGPFIARGGA